MAYDMARAKQILIDWKGDSYAFGVDVLGRTGEFAASLGSTALLVVADLGAGWITPTYDKVISSLTAKGVSFTAILGAGPNAPREDVYRIANEISRTGPDCVIAIGGGSTIDAAKCASVLAAYSTAQVMEHLGATPALASTVEPYFGVGTVTMKTLQPAVSAMSVVKRKRVAEASSPGDVSCVRSMPRRRSSTRASSMSKPVVSSWRPKCTASGSPT